MGETDKELSELAAKAAGIPIWFDDNQTPWFDGDKFIWNPLTADGDALRLAVKVGMNLCTDRYRTVSVVCEFRSKRIELFTEEFHAHDLDSKNAATRRAIVRAAAQIGKNMEKEDD